MLVSMTIPPGVYRNGTTYQTRGRWFDANLVRWYEGTMRPVGGWVKASATQMSGKARGLFTWRDNDFDRWGAIGTHSKLYAFNGGSIYDITPVGFTTGRADSIDGFGYGYSTYGSGTYGTKRTSGAVLAATVWHLDAWGENLVGCSTGDGKIYEWALNTGTPAAAVTNAPTGCTGLVVTPERYLFALGSGGNARRVQWCDQEDNATWTPASTNTAGSLELYGSGRIVAGRRVRGEILIWTETELHAMQYLGPPLVYGSQKIGAFCGLIGPNAVSMIEGGAAWMGTNTFFAFDGSVRPIPCDVQDYVFSDFNRTQSAKVYAGHNSKFGEVWWFYPSASSTENDRYVSWNYRENHWNIGSLARTCWTDAGVFPYPLAVDSDGYIYEHENGFTNNGSALTSTRYAEAGPVEIAPGDQVLSITQIIPDEKTQGQVTVSFTSQFTPQGTQYSHGPYTISSGYVDVRLTGRQIAPKVLGAADEDWRVGTFRFDAVAGGRR